MTSLTLALDAMGGDFGPHVTVPAALQALSHFPHLNLILVGDRIAIGEQLRSHNATESPRLQLLHAEQVVSMSERPAQALRTRRQSSMRLALDLVRDGQADACVSAGNTGALMAMSKVVLRTLPGIDRPALVARVPTVIGKPVYLLDLGANVVCDSDTLFQFAVMGSVLAECSDQRGAPKVALLNVGTEQVKGNDQVQQAAQLLQQTPQLNYAGFIEGDAIFKGDVDVIVCDGFVGNVTLKTTEGAARLLLQQVHDAIQGNLLAKLLGWLLKKRLKQLNQHMNPDQYNGASLLGLRGIVVKSHGNVDKTAFFHAIEQAVAEVEQQVPLQIKDRLESVLLEKS
ncbi:phosphate acyltransferase PlsX [Ferrimonas lipolytica]|uniref:Phosphate acyltransferase n=1 Tax=Ferrimonas lipolytica TaxID=2724191 RepID=A0A6H1UB35_9GAMM|nr:phosphate acyltransferase PlsX [Ferrimonas lipolytica]QIZ76048.1 phosphate acyltransferase PlsX [Ferrimonas lipolytica]